jgi:hypothetical protein
MPKVLAGCEIGHNTAMFFMERNLAVNPFAGQPVRRIENSDGSLVARAFQRENHRELAYQNAWRTMM